MPAKKKRVSSGVAELDDLLGGLFIGDNVIWYDEAGSLAAAFRLNFIQESQEQDKPLIYVSFDRSPKTLLEELGPLARGRQLTVLDCFTRGKGDGSAVFEKFYARGKVRRPCRVVRVEAPSDPARVAESVYGLHRALEGDVRFVFESLTGMQDLWGGEEPVLKFYSRACPRLYELETIAYWIVEKGAHSRRLKAHINQIAQVAVELSLRRGKTTLAILKADKRSPGARDRPFEFWCEDRAVRLETGRRVGGKIDIGLRLKQLRSQQGRPQKALAKLVGVTPSTISQIESGTILPSLPALFKIAETLGVGVGWFFQRGGTADAEAVFTGPGSPITFPDLPADGVQGRRLLPIDLGAGGEPYLIEIPPRTTVPAHFFRHKGEELGYMLAGRLQAVIGARTCPLRSGDRVRLKSEAPSQWKNPTSRPARLLWILLH